MLAFSLFAFATVAIVTSAGAETHTVQMLNKDPANKKKRNVFIPAVLKIKPGDTVKFVSIDKGHNTETIKKMLPEGAKKWKSKISRDFEITYDKIGIYGYRCTPHYALGMVGLIIVDGEGWDAKLEELKKLKQSGKAKKVFKALWAEVDALKK